MRILACGVVHNEIDNLPYLLDHLKAQGIEVFIYDNFSDDGTWEYLQKNGTQCARISSAGAFSLVEFIEKRMEKWREVQPDWCIFLDADEFPLTFQFSTLEEFIEDRDRKGFNVIQQTRINFRPTGSEDFSQGDPRKIYRYYFISLPGGRGHPQCDRIFKFSDGMKSCGGGHFIKRPDKRVSIESLDNPIFHYTMRENAQEKTLQRLERRNKDEVTVKLGWNKHYRKFVTNDEWIWDKDKLYDIENPKDALYERCRHADMKE